MLETKQKINLRIAEEKDIEDTYKLTTQKDIRKVSFNSRQIPYKSHMEWFNQKLKDKNCLFFIIEINSEFIGQFRFDINNDSALVSISLVKKYRGLGIGGFILQEAVDILKSSYPYINTIKAYIKKSNKLSAIFFEKEGFKLNMITKIENQDARLYTYKVNLS